MNNQFTFEFKNLLNAIQAKPIRVFLSIFISFTLLAFGEVSFFSSLDKMQVVGCSLPNQIDSLITIDNCYEDGFTLTTCLNTHYNSGSNKSLTYTVSMFGGESETDTKSIQLFIVAVIIFFFAQGIFQISHYFQFQKRKRLQDILAGSMVYIDGIKKYEKYLTIYFLVTGLIYVGCKIGWVVYRVGTYELIKCDNDTIYKLQFSTTLSSSLGQLITGSIAFLILPMVYIGGFMNYLSDVDFKSITKHLSKNSLKQIKNVSTLNVEIYRKLIDSTMDIRYSNDSPIKLFMRKNTFSLWVTPTSEIVEIILSHKLSNPQNFDLMLSKDPKISFISGTETEMKESLIEHKQ